jgi:DNA-binding CsgD family transcriptional regulator
VEIYAFSGSALSGNQHLGAFAFEAARTAGSVREPSWLRQGWLTPRERQIVTWLGHGESEKEIGRRLRISPVTVNDHLKHARARFGVHKSSLLVICALLTGAIGYGELLSD